MLHDMRWQGDGCCSLFIRKGSTGLVAFFESSSQQLVKRSVPLGLSGKSPHLRVVFSAKTLCKPPPATLILLQKGRVVEGLPEKSAYSDLWTHKKMSLWISKKELEEGDRRESQIQHLRWTEKDIAPPLITALTLWLKKSEQVLAIKFVQWDVPSLESLCNSKVYLLRAKLNLGECMSREEKNWLCEAVNSYTYFRTAFTLWQNNNVECIIILP